MIIIKIGGNIIDDEKILMQFLRQFANLKGNKILVHGGGKLATALGEKLGLGQKMIDGRRVTDEETLKVVTMVYAGYINKKIVASLQSAGEDAIGICGADGDLIRAHKRVSSSDYGFAGDIDKVNIELLNTFLNNKNTLVVAPLTHDGKGQLLNTNADTIAAELAKALAENHVVKLIYCFEKEGVLMDASDDHSVIVRMRERQFEELKAKGLIFAGMIPKLENAFQAIRQGVESVVIGKPDPLPDLIESRKGTTLVHD